MQFERLGPYTIGKRLGRGGMGAVFEGVNAETGETAAVKVLSPHLADDPGFRERFEIEIETLKKLRHPNIVRMFGFGEHDGYLYYAMELVRGQSVEESLQAGNRFTWREVLRNATNLCKALKHAHDHGVIHRDIKPANLLLTTSEPDEAADIKLTDFGIARLFGNQRVTMEGGLIGTAEYMSPEQAGGDRVSPKSDLYSLGCVMFAMLAGRPPFRAASLGEMLNKQRFEPAPPVSQYAREVPRELEEIVAQLLAKDPNERPTNALVLSRQLAAMEHGLSVVQNRGPSGATRVGATPMPADRTVSDRPADYDPMGPTRVAPSAGQSGLEVTQASRAQSAAPSVRTPPKPSNATAASKSGGSHIDASADELKVAPLEGVHSHVTVAENRFTTVEEDLERRERLGQEVDRAPAIAQIIVLALCLAGVIGLTVYFLQPPSADALVERIEAAAQQGDADAYTAVARDADAFLERYADDPRAEEIARHREEIALIQLEKQFNLRARLLGRDASMLPVERDYLDAMSYQLSDPTRAVAMLEALTNLYSHAVSGSPRVVQTVELARRQLRRLRSQGRDSVAGHLAVIDASLKRAVELQPEAPEQAQKIWQHIITLYGGKQWAAGAVEQAKKALENMPTSVEVPKATE